MQESSTGTIEESESDRRTESGTPDLASLRAQIDALDQRLIETLTARFRVAEAVGELKHRHGILPVDPAREAEIVKRATGVARSSGVPEEGVRDVFWAVLGYCRDGVRGAGSGPRADVPEDGA